MRTVFISLLVIHAMIHLLGFAKGFNLGNITTITKPISGFMGIMWLSTFAILAISILMLLLKNDQWYLPAIVGSIFSQLLLISVWHDAKFGTIANVIILIAAIFHFGALHFENAFRKDVDYNLAKEAGRLHQILTEADLTNLPEPIRRYLRFSKVIGTPKVRSMKVDFIGQMREKGKDYFPFTSEQYNFFEEPTRLFFMKAKMYGLPVLGYHKYSDCKATMDIKLFGLFSIVRKSGPEMDQAETVTLFNDMCLMAPASLINKNIKWEIINDTTVNATFMNREITIHAKLFFTAEGKLINFISNDRTAISEMKNFPFLTPVSEYKVIHGYNLFSKGETVWQYPDGLFTYGKFDLKDINYNIIQ